MKRKLWKAAILAATLMLAGCGKQDGEDIKVSTDVSSEAVAGGSAATVEITPLAEMDLESIVTLCDYKNIKVNVDSVRVSENDLAALMSSVYAEALTEDNGGIVDRAVEVGDTAIIDYEGKKDGVAFAGGTAQYQPLTIGSGQFIDGFEDGLIGVMPGETVDLNLTFPENYGNTELAGQAVVFTVKVHFIRPAFVAKEDMVDEIVAAIGINGVNTVQEYEDFVRDYLEQTAQSTHDEEIESQIAEYLLENCTFGTLPEDHLNWYKNEVYSDITNGAMQYNVDVETYCNYFFQMNSADTINSYGEMTLKQDIIMQAIANKENLNVTEEEIREKLLVYAQAAGLSTVEEYLGGTSVNDYKSYFLNQKINDFLLEQADITEN